MQLKNKVIYLYLALFVIAVDQASKMLVRHLIPYMFWRDIIPDCLRLWHVRNSGAVWGLLDGHGMAVTTTITVLALAALLFVLFVFLKTEPQNRLELTSLAFVLGGALGNIIDRLRHGFVTDFFDVYVGNRHFPTFNVADSFITVGVLLLALSLWRGKCTRS